MKNLRYFSESIKWGLPVGGPSLKEELEHLPVTAPLITESELQDLDDMFAIVADTWDIVPTPTEGYESSSFFHGDYLMTLNEGGMCVNFEIDKPGEVTESMESSLNNFRKRLSRKGYSDSLRRLHSVSRLIGNSWIIVSSFSGLIWKEKINESVSSEPPYNLEPIFQEIDKFLSGTPRNLWIADNDDNPIFSIYVRKSKRFIGGLYRDFLDLATINISKDYRGRKIFQRFLRRLIDEYPNNIYVESILNPAVDHICSKFGFSPTGHDNMYLIQSVNESENL